MTPIRLAIVTETYVPDVNGVANSLRQLLRALDPEQYRIQIIRTRPRAEWVPEHEEVWCHGLTIPMYPDLQLGLPARRKIRRVWDSFQPDAVYIATEGPLGVSALNEARRRGLPVISAFHTNFHRYSGYYGLGWIKTLTLSWLRRFHNRTAVTLVPSADIATDLRAEGFTPVEVLSHGVDCRLFHPRRRSGTLRQSWQVENEPVLLYVGRIAAEKNIPLAIRTWQALRADRPDLKLVMVGDGPLRAELSREYPDILFAGVQTGERLAQYFASADAFVFPSLTETFGLVTLEAMASGLPVVAFDMAAAALHVCPGKNGELAQGTDDEEFIRAAARLMQLDLAQAGENARTEAEMASWDSIAARFDQLVHQQLNDSPAALTQSFQTLV
ncbi:glycosyltransferase family 4 protein [Thalassolituus sp. LLYu03]|uniref:glycosyltransferase family 4 protein n=1 Tax=Thalassolituus sp. LLYu03 TaxID=3421656 RepID=UPI003D2D93CE